MQRAGSRGGGIFILVSVLLALVPSASQAHHKPDHSVPPPLATPSPSSTSSPEPEPCPPHPYPCGDEWPTSLTGPFRLRGGAPEHVQVETFDGVKLDGWIGIPELPEGVGAPVILQATPYVDYCSPLGAGTPGPRCWATPGNPGWWTDYSPATGGSSAAQRAWSRWRVAPIEMVRAGYAVAFFSVRGTGRSGGCFDRLGPKEQQDTEVLVEWLGEQEWSNGRVGMGGVSYDGSTPWEAAVAGPTALKTIVTAGIEVEEYTWVHTPQGAEIADSNHFDVPWTAGIAGMPFGDDQVTPDDVPYVADVACEGALTSMGGAAAGLASDDRMPQWYSDRNLLARFEDVTSSVLLAQGFDDAHHHAFQDSAVWDSLTQAPKRQIVGQWGHSFPDTTRNLVTYDPTWDSQTWNELLMSWFDYWLKGIGSPERLGVVDYQDGDKTWHSSESWPPAEVREEVLYLSDDLATTPGDGSRSFLSAPSPWNAYEAADDSNFVVQPWAALCQGTPGSLLGGGLAYLSEPLPQDVVIAGNPFAYLRLSSDLPGGLLAAHVVDVDEGFRCNDLAEPKGTDPAHPVKTLAFGAADLRFHQGNMVGRDFPINEPTGVRIDLLDLAERVPAGHRIGLVLSYGDPIFSADYINRGLFPNITIHGDVSQIVLPLVEGSVGGSSPSIAYPPRPFVPGAE